MTAKLQWYKPDFLKDLRKRLGMTQPQLAALCGFSRDDIANFERGLTRLSADDALKLYEAMASTDTTGDANSAALAAATAERESLQRQLKETEREVEQKQKKLQSVQAWLVEAKANEKRLKALKSAKSN